MKFDIRSAGCGPTGITALYPMERNLSFLNIHKDSNEWRDPCTKKWLLSPHTILLLKKKTRQKYCFHLLFFFLLKLQAKPSSADLLLYLHYSNTCNTISLTKIKLRELAGTRQQLFHRKIVLEKVSTSSKYRYLYGMINLSLSLFLILWNARTSLDSLHKQIF